MIRAVLDTNVVISALIFEGAATALVPAWQRHAFALLVSASLLGEYIRVLHYPKFQLSRDAIGDLVERELLPFITSVKVKTTPRVITADPADDHVLACAVAGRADVIVSGDHHLLDLKQYRGIPVIAVAEFLKRLSSSR